MTATVRKLGPGTITVGATGTPVDFSCQVTAATVAWDVSADDPVTVLCGDQVPGARTYSSTFAGTLFQDLGLVGGIVEYSWAHKGETVPFVFTPSTEVGTTVSGDLILDPLSVGGDTAGANMTSDFEWSIVGDPVLADGAGVAGAAHGETVGATY